MSYRMDQANIMSAVLIRVESYVTGTNNVPLFLRRKEGLQRWRSRVTSNGFTVTRSFSR